MLLDRVGDCSIHEPDFNKGGGLLPTVVQDNTTKAVLMVAWMNEESFIKHWKPRKLGFGRVLAKNFGIKAVPVAMCNNVVDMKLDCDGDTLLVLVNAEGPACHTGAVSCFFNDVEA